MPVTERELVASTADALVASVESAVDGADAVEVLFSGGLDSALLAHLARRFRPTRLVTVGLPGAPDLTIAKGAAGKLGLEWRGVTIAPSEAATIGRPWLERSEGTSPVVKAVRVAFALALSATGPGRVLTGQGADELYYGYAHFRSLTRPQAIRRQADDLDRLLGQEWPFALDIAEERHIDLRAPFLDARVVRAALALRPPAFADGEVPKARLREAAVTLGLPAELAAAPKKALQYGSGVDRFLRKARYH